MSDTMRFKHHAITIPQLTPADRIMEANRQLDDTLKQQPKKSPMDKITVIELLREVLLGERKEKLPKNSVQTKISQHKIMVPTKTTTKPADNEDENTTINHRQRKNQRVRAQKRKPNNNRITFIAEN